MNIIDAIRHHARLRPFELAIIHGSGAVTYRQLALATAAMAMKLRSHGIQPGQTIAVYVNDAFLHMVLLLGAMSNGTVTVSAHPNFEPIPGSVKVDAYLVDKALPFSPPRGEVIPVGTNWLTDVLKESHTALPDSGFTDPDALVRLYTSSGTTGTPKVIGYTQGHAEQLLKGDLALDPQMRGPHVCMMWLSTIGGHGITQLGLWHGSTLILATAPLAVLRAINLYNVENLRTSPQQLQGLIDMVRGQTVWFPSLKRIEVGGASIPSTLLVQARALLCPNVMGIYGSTEAGLIAQAPGAVLGTFPDAAGYVVPDVDVKILNEDGADVGFDTEGVVYLRTRTMIKGYLGDEQATANSFREGWFIPGDLGILRADGLLRITGRADEVINAGGVKLNPAVVDEFLMTLPGVVDVATFAFRQSGRQDEIWAAVVSTEGFNEQAVLAAALQKLNSRAPRRLVRIGEIPRNAMGKAMRQKLSQDALLQ